MKPCYANGRRSSPGWTKRRSNSKPPRPSNALPGNGQNTAAEEDWLTHTGERLGTAEALLQRPDFAQLLGKDGRDYLQACRKKDEAIRAEREAQAKRIAEEQERVAKEQVRTARLQRWSTGLLGIDCHHYCHIGNHGSSLKLVKLRAKRRSYLATAARTANNIGDAYNQALRLAILGTKTNWLTPNVPEAEAQLARGAHSSRHVAELKGHTESGEHRRL